MRPKVSLLCMITQDAGYESQGLNVDIYYEAGFELGADAVMAGADSMLEGLAGFGGAANDESFPAEKAADPSLPWLIITDSRGRLSGNLGNYRNMEYIRDVIVLISESTPEEYIGYLDRNGYRYLKTGKARCDIGKALEKLHSELGIRHVRVDSVGSLASQFLNEGLADEMLTIFSPFVLKSPSARAFSGLVRDIGLSLVSTGPLRDGYILARYLIEK